MAVSKAMKEKILSYYHEAYREYRDGVLSGQRVAGLSERLKVERQERDLEEGVPGYVFDIDRGVSPLLWITLNLRFPLGEKMGKPMKLAPWEAYDIICLFGWVSEKNSKKRRYTDAFIEVARKNGKSTFAGAILDYLAFGEIPGARCYIAATSLDQAEETFIRAGEALKLAKGSTVLVSNSKNYKAIKYKSGIIKAITGNPQDGKLAYGTVIDEYHQHKDNSLIQSIRSGNVSDQQSMLLRITTAGTDLNGVCHEEYEKCKRILSGEAHVSRYYVSIYELDEDDNAEDMTVWPKANPNWGDSIDTEAMKGIYEDACLSETGMVDFKTKNLNMWCHGLLRWANMAIWLEKCKWTVDEKSLRGKVAYGGLDLSSVSDFTAFTLDFPLEGGKHIQDTHCWVAESAVDKIARECRIPLRRWIHDGWVTATPGDVIDYEYVRDFLCEAYETYTIPYIAADRWKIQELVRIMPSWFEDVAFEFSQGMKTMSPTITDFERTYFQGLVSANGNEVIDWMMSNAEVMQDSSGNVKLVKPRRRSGARIDGVITSVMALNTAKTQDVAPLTDEEIARMVSFF